MGGGVGQHRAHVEIDHRDVVDAGGDPGTDHQLDDDPGRRAIGADIGKGADAVAGHLAFGVEREFGIALDIAAVRGGQELIEAGRRPLHRAADLAGGEDDGDVLGVHAGFHAEAAADIADDDADLVVRDAQRAGNAVAGAGRRLARQAQRHAIGFGVIVRERAARLHRGGDQPLVDQVQRHDMRGRSERGLARRGIAVHHLRGDVAGGGRPDQRRAVGHRLVQADDDGQVFVFDGNRFQRVLRLLRRFGDDRHDGFADEAHHAVGQRRAQRRGAGRAVRALEDRRHRHRLHAGGHEVGAGQDQEHARHRRRGGRVDGDDPGMRLGRTQEADMCLVRQGEVVGEPPGAGQQSDILDAFDRATAAEASHRCPGVCHPIWHGLIGLHYASDDARVSGLVTVFNIHLSCPIG